MYCRYITGAKKNIKFFLKKKMTYPGALKTAGIGFGNFFYFKNDLSQNF